MKKLIGVLVIMTMVLSLSAQEQRQERRIEFRKQGFMQADPVQMIPQLTTEQRAEIAKLKLENQKQMLNFENRILEKNVQLRILEQTDKPDIKKINEKIDEISDLQNMKMKASAAHKVKVRALLTDEQRVWMDSAKGRKSFRNGQPGLIGNRAAMTGRIMRPGAGRMQPATEAVVKSGAEVK